MINGFDINGGEIDGPPGWSLAFYAPVVELTWIVPVERRALRVPPDIRTFEVKGLRAFRVPPDDRTYNVPFTRRTP